MIDILLSFVFGMFAGAFLMLLFLALTGDL
jgi:hypothetical protein